LNTFEKMLRNAVYNTVGSGIDIPSSLQRRAAAQKRCISLSAVSGFEHGAGSLNCRRTAAF